MPSASATSSTPRATAAAPSPRLSSAQRELGPHRAHHELGLGVLEAATPANAPRLGGAVLARVQAGERHPPGEATAVEVRHQPAGGAQQRRLAVPGEAREQAELARLDLEADLRERGARDPRIVVGDVLDRQQRGTHGSIPRRSANGSSTAPISAAHSTMVPAPVGA